MSLRVRGTDRGVSVTVNYVLALAITALLISGLLIAGGDYLEGQRESVTRHQLGVTAEQLAGGIADADRLAAGGERVSVEIGLPRTVAGSAYRIRVTEVSDPPDQPGEYALLLTSPPVGTSVELTVRTSVPLAERTVEGGTVVVRLHGDGDTSELVVGSGPVTPALFAVAGFDRRAASAADAIGGSA